jgi:hypothetical protein
LIKVESSILIKEMAALNVLTERFKTINCGSRFQSDIVQGKKTILVFYDALVSYDEVIYDSYLGDNCILFENLIGAN